MPYENELANKSSHSDIVKNEDVLEFLRECEYLREPTAEEVAALSQRFVEAPSCEEDSLPKHIFASDGSAYEALIDKRLPSTKVAYIKVSTIHILMDEFGALRAEDPRFVDPFRVAQLRRNKDSLLFVLPSSNMKWKGYRSVRDSFRARLDAELLKPETRFTKSDYKTSLRSTLFFLAARRPDQEPDERDTLRLHACPTCGTKDVLVRDILERQECPSCHEEVYPSDALRLWEEVSDFQSTVTAMTRFMLAVEHMLPAHYLRNLLAANIALSHLSSIAFFIDGPLAVFGNCAWISRPLMSYYAEINERLRALGLGEVTIIGLQKTGQLADYFTVIDRHISDGRIYAVDDEFRYKYVIASREASSNGFGDETYYGQDFLFKTPSGRRFVVGLTYPIKSKRDTANFHQIKTQLDLYPNLGRALSLISRFETDLYANAVIPVALAHRYTAISAMPGGRVLDIFSKGGFRKP